MFLARKSLCVCLWFSYVTNDTIWQLLQLLSKLIELSLMLLLLRVLLFYKDICDTFYNILNYK